MPSYTLTLHLPRTESDKTNFCNIISHLSTQYHYENYYCQADSSEASPFHIHVCLQCTPTAFRSTYQQLKAWMKQKYSNQENVDQHIAIPRTPSGRVKQINFGDYIGRYLLVKTNIQWWCGKTNGKGTTRDSYSQLIPKPTSNRAVAMQYVYQRCVDNWWLEINDIQREFPDYYWRCLSTGSDRTITKLLELVRCKLLETETLGTYMQKQKPTRTTWSQHPPSDWLALTLQANQIQSAKFAKSFYDWSTHASQKQNALVFQGPPNTGKTLIAESIIYTSPHYACTNKNNENFPFSDCTSTFLIWWEECTITEKTVDDAKCIMAGTPVKVDRKGRSQAPIPRTPIIITTNDHFGRVHSGNITTMQHLPALHARSYIYTLHHNWADTGIQYPSRNLREQTMIDWFHYGSTLTAP
uniref:NS1 n=1 Tax=Dinematichthys parvovirus TaxID=2951515 RepID=A0A9Y1GE38_9VIRU|nr:MAG: NS1 [Dinematichthys parvovirus]